MDQPIFPILNIINRRFLGLASSPYETSTVIPVCLSVRQTKLIYFPPLDFSDVLHQVKLAQNGPNYGHFIDFELLDFSDFVYKVEKLACTEIFAKTYFQKKNCSREIFQNYEIRKIYHKNSLTWKMKYSYMHQFANLRVKKDV